MSATYTNNPENNNTDAVRLLTRDTNTANATLSDEEIAYFLAEEPNVWYAAAAALEAKAEDFAEKPSLRIGDLQRTWPVMGSAEAIERLARSLRRRGNSSLTPFSGGISKAEKKTAKNDTDWNQPSVSVGMHDYTSASSS